jgi:enoyl-CoA hydratase/carnithine racemase
VSTQDWVQVHWEAPVGRIVLARPEKRNAMTLAMVQRVADTVRRFDAAPEIEVIVLEAEGEAFCSGGDLAEYKGVAIDHQRAWELLSTGHDLCSSIEGSGTVVVAKVQGLAYAGGLLLSLCADITIAAAGARFAIPEMRVARPDPFIPARLVAKVGLERAGYLMLTATPIDGVEAERIGLISRCVDDDRLDAAVKETVDAILAGDAASRAVWKGILRRTVMPVDARSLVRHFTSEAMGERAAPFVRPEE